MACKIFIHWHLGVLPPCPLQLKLSSLLLIHYTFRSNALPPLDWPLPSQFDQYELRIEVQPRPHHRAHYETEGSRGAVKAAPTGHPVVKVKPKPAVAFSFVLVFLILEQSPRTRVVAHCCWARHSLISSLTLCLSVQLCGYTERKPLSLQVYVGTADDRSIRPHPFYQIHRYWTGFLSKIKLITKDPSVIHWYSRDTTYCIIHLLTTVALTIAQLTTSCF